MSLQEGYGGNPNNAVLPQRQRTTDDDWSDYNALKGKLGREPTADELRARGADPNAPRVTDAMGKAAAAAGWQQQRDRAAAEAAQQERAGFQNAYNQSHDAYRAARTQGIQDENAYQSWVGQQTFDEQTGAGASGGRNTASWQDMGRYGYRDDVGYKSLKGYSGPSGEGKVDWNMLGTGGGYEEKERKDAMAARSAWDAAAAGNKAASAYYADRNMDKLERNYGDQREAWTNYTDWDTGQTSERNRRGMGGSYIRPGDNTFGSGGSAMASNVLQGIAQGIYAKPRPAFGGGGVGGGSAAGSAGAGTQDWVPESARTPGVGGPSIMDRFGNGMLSTNIRWGK